MKRYTLDAESIGNKLRDLRIGRNLTISDLSEATQIGESALRNYENGLRIPRDEAKLALSDFYGVSTDAIFFRSDDTDSDIESDDEDEYGDYE